VWARKADETRHILDAGDVESTLRAAAAVGDDTLQRRTTLRRTGVLHPRYFGRARQLVQARTEQRADRELR